MNARSYPSAAIAGANVIDASRLPRDATYEADVAIVGTGAGGGIAAEILAEAGLSVVMVEEGPLATSREFNMRESEAYPHLYHDSGARKTADHAITILQGRCVGGGTTVNWTSSFRTPATTLAWWQREFGLADFTVDALAPWFERVEQRLAIAPWDVAPNANNEALARGARELGLAPAVIRRNVKGCANLGYCGMGCPFDAKQSMLVTTVPGALARGATLVTRARAQRLAIANGRVTALEAVAMDAAGIAPTARRITVRARTYVAAAGAIGTPALLLRSRAPDPYGLVGRRTFLHPVAISAAVMPDVVDGFAGAPQSIYTDHYLDTQPVDGPIGFKLEAPPLHPMLTAITLPSDGARHAQWMREFRHMQVVLALLRDGFHPDSPGGTVRLRDDGTPVLDYPLTRFVWDGVRRALVAMAEIQFAAGATRVSPGHGDGPEFTRFAQARAAIAAFDLKPLATRVVSAHVMGGAPLGPDPRRAVVDVRGRHHQVGNLYVLDGSLFPTSVGANPQLSIYGIAARLASGIAERG
ncbi:MAG: GMC family oxidoreductase [Burkholderiales bacterium]